VIQIGNWLLSGKDTSREQFAKMGRFLFGFGDHLKSLNDDYHIVAIQDQLYAEERFDKILKQIKSSIPYDPRTGHDHNSRRSFMGSSDQWDKFLAWEAHGGNAYRAAAEFLPKLLTASQKKLPAALSRSEIQRDVTSSIRRATEAIQGWIAKVYPTRDLTPVTLRNPKAA